MRLKIPEISITKDDPFSMDLLDRKESAIVLTELVASQAGLIRDQQKDDQHQDLTTAQDHQIGVTEQDRR